MSPSLSPPSSALDLRDPAGLVARSPELAVLAAKSPALRRAIERGRPLDAYRALYWARLFRRFGDLDDLAAALLVQRRVFVKPLSGAPALFTYNGVGSSLYGRSDCDGNDGTYVATLFFVVVFIPVFPLTSYLVMDGTEPGRSWRFLAKVPLGTAAYVWQRAIALGLLLLLLSGVASAFDGYTWSAIHVVNGLDQTVTVSVEGAKDTVLIPNEHAVLKVRVGKHDVAVKRGDALLERGSIDAPRGKEAFAVWNVMGAAPVFARTVYYGADSHTRPLGSADKPTVFCGQSAIVERGVDYGFQPPPERISMPKHSSVATKRHLGLLPQGAAMCVQMAAARAQSASSPEEAAAMARKALAAAENVGFTKVHAYASAALAALPPDEAERAARAIVARDDGVDAHRTLQDLLLGSGQRARVIAEYDARAAARPDSDDAAYLALRAHPMAEQLKTVDALVARFPRHARLLRLQAYAYYAARDTERTVAASEALRTLDREQWVPEIHVHALLAAKRGAEALALAREVASNAPDGERRGASLDAYRVARALGQHSVPPGDDSPEKAWGRVYAGDEVSAGDLAALEPHLAEGARVALAGARSAEEGLAAASEASSEGLAQTPTAMRVLLFAEAVRRGEPRDRLEHLRGQLPWLRSVEEYVRSGARAEDIDGLPGELRAAIGFARSRVSGLPKAERDALARTARMDDVLHGPVTRAMDTWGAAR